MAQYKVAEDEAKEEPDDGSRLSRLQHLIGEIRKKAPARKKPNNPIEPSRRGRRRTYKLHLGWQHHSNGQYRVVTARKGGGTRSLEYEGSTEMTVLDLIELGKKIFFPEGINSAGNISDMDVTLSNCSGTGIVDFTDLNGDVCSFQTYLKVHGLYSSQFHLYLRTKAKDLVNVVQDSELPVQQQYVDHMDTCTTENSEPVLEMNTVDDVIKTPSEIQVNDEVPGLIEITYTKTSESLYSSHGISVICHSHNDCFQVSGLPEECKSDWDIYDLGYRVTSVIKNGVHFLDESIDGSYTFPQTTVSGEVIAHGPSEINGFDTDGNFVIGVVSNHHNRGCVHHWYKNDTLLSSGVNRCLITVNEPGVYRVVLSVPEGLVICEPGIRITTCTGPLKTEETVSSPEHTTWSSASTCQDQPINITRDLEGFNNKKLGVTSTCDVEGKVGDTCSVKSLANEESDTTGNESDMNKQTSVGTSLISPDSSESDSKLSKHANPSGDPDTDLMKVNVTDLNILDEIGKGSFGVVYRAKWIGTTVAVKKVTVKRMKTIKPMVYRELQVHSKIRHPNIVQIMAYASDKDQLYLISEFIDGNNLDDILFGDGTSENLNIAAKVSIGQQVTQAVAYLHNLSPVILHRDIKPENVLVSKNLQIVRLCDMGVSKLKTMHTLITTNAGSNSSQPGTPSYQAPEIVLEKSSASLDTDIWSLSCTLCELFTVEPIWSMDSMCDALFVQKMKKKEIPDGLQLLIERSKLPQILLGVVQRGLHYDAKERPTALNILSVIQTTFE